jgi:hypothetical protein
VQSLWIGPWLRDVGGFDRGDVIALMTWFAAMSVLGFAIGGACYDRLIRRGASPVTLYKVQTAIGIVLFTLAVFGGRSLAVPMWIVYFLVGSGGTLVLAALAREFPAHFSGRVNTANNTLMFTIAFGFQWGIGAVLDQWPVIDGRYSAAGYQVAFAVLLALQLAAYALLAFGGRGKRASPTSPGGVKP